MKRFLLFLLAAYSFYCFATDPTAHCNEDASKVDEILSRLKSSDLPIEKRIILIAEEFEGSPQDDYYTTDSVASLRMNIDSFSPLMFVNNVIAIAKASDAPGSPDWNTFWKEFENISCRRGENKGFPSIMYHTSDWIGDNIARGNIIELTENYAGVVDRTKSLDEMTRKRGNYAVLSDSATFETVRMTEMGFRTHRVASLKKETIKKKDLQNDLQDGDIIILVPNRDGIDCYDIGFLKFEDGIPFLIHVSPKTHTVVKEKDDLVRYMSQMTKYFQGYRLLRIKD